MGERRGKKKNPSEKEFEGERRGEEKCHIQNHVSVRSVEKNSIPPRNMRMLWEERNIVGTVATMPY